VEYQVDSGPWTDASPLFSAGAGYDGRISSCCGNPLAGRQAFAGESFGYTATQLDLSSLAGQSVRFGFRLGSDDRVGDWGWFIDAVRVFTCAPSDLIFADDFEGMPS
jgi:bacillolysin